MGKLNKLKTVFEQVIGKAKVDEKTDEKMTAGGKGVSIEKKFYEEMVSYFREIVESRSVGKSMIFHMGYLVWLDQKDYDVLRDELIVLIPEVVDAFYDIIKEYIEEYPNSKPPSTEWFFQITPTSVVPKNEDGMEEFVNLQRGKFIISSTFHSVKRWSNVQAQDNVVFSFRPQNSNVMKDLNVNRDLLLGIEALSRDGAGIYAPKFDYGKCGLSKKSGMEDDYGMREYATLKYSKGSQNVTYIVKNKSFFVSGSSDERKQYNVLVLPDESVEKGHLTFRYREEDNRFEVAAYGYTVLNERQLKLSTQDAIVWYKVSPKASFVLGDGFGLEFNQID